MVTVKPDIGQWYLDRRGAAFEVVAIDNDDRTIEIQSYDGTVYEIDEDSWANHAAEEIEPPEDYSGSLDMATEDAFTSQFVPKQYWSDPLDFIDEDYFDPQD